MALLGPEVTTKACIFPLNLTWKKTPVLATSTINTPRRKTIPTYRMSERRDACLFMLPFPYNVLGKRAGQASEPVKILHIQHLTTYYISNIEDIETKQIALSFTYPNSMFARTTLAISE
jgi:hypothetical protein